MMSRRMFVAAAAIACDLAPSAGISAETSRPRFALPPGACDTHVHVLDPARFAYSAKRRYTPGPATAESLARFHAALGVERAVVIQNSVYGADNRVIVDAIRQLGTLRARGVATLDRDATPAEIEELDRNGIRGARLNLEVGRERNVSIAALQVEDAARRIPQSWSIHINASLAVIAGIQDTILSLDRRIVLDHFAHANVPPGIDQPGFSNVVALLQAGRIVVKLSAPYQISKVAGYVDVAPVARAFVAAAPDHVIWGSDWPHTGGSSRQANQSVDVIEPFRLDDDGFNLDLLAEWVPDRAMRRLILVETPAKLYGFA